MKRPAAPDTDSSSPTHRAALQWRRNAHPRSADTPRAPRSPRASRTTLLGPCAAHAAAAVSHLRGSHTAKPHRPPPLPDVQHGRRPGKPAANTRPHPLPPAHTAEPAPHTHSGTHRAAGWRSASARPLLRGAAAVAPFVPRVRGRSETGDLPRHSAVLHLPGPRHRLGCLPQRPRRPCAAAARCARHLRNSQARLNRHHRWPRCGAPRGDLPEPRRWKVAAGGGRSAHVATWEVRASAAVASAKGAVPIAMHASYPADIRCYLVVP